MTSRDARPDERVSFVHNYVRGDDNGTTLLLLHGTGGDENSLLPIARMLSPGASVLAVRGRVLENGMPRFFRRFAEGVFDVEDVKFRANELADFLASSSRRYGFSPDSLVAVGYSNGANIGAATMLVRPEAFERAILFRPMLPFMPLVLPDLSRASIFISAGTHDPIVSQEKTDELASVLERAGADVTVNRERATHSLTEADLQKAKAWLHR